MYIIVLLTFFHSPSIIMLDFMPLPLYKTQSANPMMANKKTRVEWNDGKQKKKKKRRSRCSTMPGRYMEYISQTAVKDGSLWKE